MQIMALSVEMREVGRGGRGYIIAPSSKVLYLVTASIDYIFGGTGRAVCTLQLEI